MQKKEQHRFSWMNYIHGENVDVMRFVNSNTEKHTLVHASTLLTWTRTDLVSCNVVGKQIMNRNINDLLTWIQMNKECVLFTDKRNERKHAQIWETLRMIAIQYTNNNKAKYTSQLQSTLCWSNPPQKSSVIFAPWSNKWYICRTTCNSEDFICARKRKE